MPSGPVASAERIIAFFEKTGTLPRATADPGREEEQLYRGVKRMRILHRQGKLNKAAAALLDAGCPGWADGRAFGSDRLWRERRDELIAWTQKNGRPPHPSAGDETERSLASLVAAYRKHALHGRHPERIQELNAMAPGWAETPTWASKSSAAGKV